MFAPRTIRKLRIDPAALALVKPAARVERESSMVRRIGGAASPFRDPATLCSRPAAS